MLELIQNMSPEQRIATTGLLVGGLMNGIKRWPKLPAQWVPLVSLIVAAAISAGYFFVANLSTVGMFDFVVSAVLAGSLPIAGHKFIKAPWVAFLGEESADKWLGQADKEQDEEGPDDPPTNTALLILFVSLSVFLTGCGGSFATVSNDALESAAKGNNRLVDTLNAVQESARSSRKILLNRIATTAPSEEEGMKAFDEVDAKFKHVWSALEKAEDAQHALAEAIEAARAALNLGESPSIDNVVALFAELQEAQAAVSSALAEVR